MYNQISDKYKETELQKIRRVNVTHLSASAHEFILVIVFIHTMHVGSIHRFIVSTDCKKFFHVGSTRL